MRRLLLVAFLIVGCSGSDGSADNETSSSTPPTTSIPTTTTTEPVPLALTSPVFEDGTPIPVEYTCDGADVSPELNIVGVPEGAESLVIIVDDPDAAIGTWDHWVEFDVGATGIAMDVARDAGEIGIAGLNSWNLPGYMGPCPPEGEEHRYFFTVYALNTLLDLPPEVQSEVVYEAMENRVISTAELMGTYAR